MRIGHAPLSRVMTSSCERGGPIAALSWKAGSGLSCKYWQATGRRSQAPKVSQNCSVHSVQPSERHTRGQGLSWHHTPSIPRHSRLLVTSSA